MRWILALAAAAAFGLFGGLAAAILGPAGPAAAHAVLLRTAPASGAVVDPAPRQVVLSFSEPVRPVPGQVRVIAPDGGRGDTGTPSASGNDLRLRLRDAPADGTYLVTFRVISADGHPVAGGFSFSVGAPSQAPPAPPGFGDEAVVDPVVTVSMPIARYVGYAGLVLVVGPALIVGSLWPRRLSVRGPRRLMWCGLGAIGASCLAELYLQAPHTVGGGVFDVSGGDLAGVLGSRFGAAHLVRLVVVGAAAPLLAAVISARRPGRADRLLLAGLGVVGLFTWPLSGHPGASPAPPLSVALDAVHLAAMAVWLGGLVMLARYLLPGARRRELAGMLPVWSRWAMFAVAALAVSGLAQGVVEVATPEALVRTQYGVLVLAKVLLFTVAIAAAAFARRYAQRFGEPDGGPDGTAEAATGESPPDAAGGHGRPLRRVVLAEVTVAAVVLALAGVLVQTTPARTAITARQSTVDQPFSATLTVGQLVLQVDIDPARVGNNTLHLVAVTPAGAPVKVLRWQATVGRPQAGVAPIGIPLVALTDNHSIGEIALPTAGEWEFRFTLQISALDQTTASAKVPIR